MYRRIHYRNRGLTLVELMVVILIIGLIASVLVIGVNAAFSSGEESVTEANIKSLSNGVQAFQERYLAYPSNRVDDLTRLMVREDTKYFSANEINQGCESLVIALRSRVEGGPFIGSDLLNSFSINTDNDELTENFANVEGNLKLFEIRDGWGNPLVYFNLNDPWYEDAYPLQVQTRDGVVESIDIAKLREALRHPDTGVSVSKTFVIWSFGPNGVNEYGRGDDITSFPKIDGDLESSEGDDSEDSGEEPDATAE